MIHISPTSFLYIASKPYYVNIISIQNNLGIPKYKEIIASIENSINKKNLKKGHIILKVLKLLLKSGFFFFSMNLIIFVWKMK